MKKVALLVSTFILFAGLTFAQTPQTQDKAKTEPAKTESTKKDSKDCSKTCTTKEKSACCAKKGAEQKDTKTPEKK